MKKLIFTFLILVGLMSVQANALKSILRIKMHDHSSLYVVFDNQIINSNNSTCLISNVSAGYHFIKVFRINQGHGNNHPSMHRPVFQGNIFIPCGYRILAMINRFNQYFIVKKAPLNQHYPNNYYNDYENNDTYNGFYDQDNGSNCNGDYNNYPASDNLVCMNLYSFQALKSSIENKNFENSKLLIARQAATSNYFTSQQIFELTCLFTYESTKLEFAKFAYAHTIDKQNYYLVNNAFGFESSIMDLDGYIRGH